MFLSDLLASRILFQFTFFHIAFTLILLVFSSDSVITIQKTSVFLHSHVSHSPGYERPLTIGGDIPQKTSLCWVLPQHSH